MKESEHEDGGERAREGQKTDGHASAGETTFPSTWSIKGGQAASEPSHRRGAEVSSSRNQPYRQTSCIDAVTV